MNRNQNSNPISAEEQRLIVEHTRFRQVISDVKDRIDLSELIGENVDLKPVGSVLKGRSPWNQDTNPSFVIWPYSQHWMDYSGGGNKGGDCFDYIQYREGVGFMESLRILAAKAAVALPSSSSKDDAGILRKIIARRRFEELLIATADYYHRVLPSKIRRELYQGKYGFTDDTIDSLCLGWSDGHLFEHLTEVVGATTREALGTGLFVIAKNQFHDFFCDRLVFPYWKNGRVVYFIARATEYTADEPWEQAKYKKLLTHSEKHSYVSRIVANDTFYNEDATRSAKQLLIVEGVTDCISARQAGIACISPVTVRFRKRDHDKLIKLTSHAKQIIICNDSEENGVGETGAIETARVLHAAGRDVRIAVIPRAQGVAKVDVNEIVAKQGPDALKTVLASARSLPQYLLAIIPDEIESSRVTETLDPVFEVLASSKPLERDICLKEISSRFGIGKRAINSAFKQSEREVRKSRIAALSKNSKPAVQVNNRQSIAIVREIRDIVIPENRRRIDAKESCSEPPLLFRRLGKLVYLNVFEDSIPELAECTEAGIYGVFIRYADWIKIHSDGEVSAATPPKDVCQDILTYVPKQLPRLDSVITTPVFGRKGEILLEPGLHIEDCTWLELDKSLELAEVPKQPTRDQIACARAMFDDDLFVDFRFVSAADRAHMMALLLLPFVRRLIEGSTPLHLVEAPAVGSGKGLLCHLASIVATGRQCDMSTLPNDEEEIRKTLSAELLKAGTFIVLDNAKERKTVDSQALTSLLTTQSWKCRILGKTEMIHLPNLAAWVLTGNNVRLSEELTRRCVRIRIDPGVECAWQRKDFKHNPIEAWAKQNRAQLVHAALVLVQAWIAAGSPEGKATLGSYAKWAAVMGGLLEVIDVYGFLGNIDEMRNLNEFDNEQWREFTAPPCQASCRMSWI